MGGGGGGGGAINREGAFIRINTVCVLDWLILDYICASRYQYELTPLPPMESMFNNT